jgi:hypothetical protein
VGGEKNYTVEVWGAIQKGEVTLTQGINLKNANKRKSIRVKTVESTGSKLSFLSRLRELSVHC